MMRMEMMNVGGKSERKLYSLVVAGSTIPLFFGFPVSSIMLIHRILFNRAG